MGIFLFRPECGAARRVPIRWTNGNHEEIYAPSAPFQKVTETIEQAVAAQKMVLHPEVRAVGAGLDPIF